MFSRQRSLRHCKGGRSSDFLNEVIGCLDGAISSAIRAYNYKLCSVGELNKRLDFEYSSKSLYIHKVGSKRITSMPTITAVDNVIEISSKIYDVKK